jgi:hypothetical protein
MTSLITWAGVDTHGIASIYIASDSRVTWGKERKWDYARKIFASLNYPDILGYFGDVSFPSHVLGQLMDLIDTKVLFSNNDLLDAKVSKVFKLIKDSFGDYPTDQSHPFAIIYCTRENEGLQSLFHISLLGWSLEKGWYEERPKLPQTSSIIYVLGTGKASIEKWYERWNSIKNEKGTSRAIFSAFCDSLASESDDFSGGAPQLVGIYRKWVGKNFGVLYKGKRYILGLPVNEINNLESLEWRNSLFERCDGVTMRRLDDAQTHTRPRGLGKSL